MTADFLHLMGLASFLYSIGYKFVFMYWISVENGDRNIIEIVKANESMLMAALNVLL
jgi:hypothetical protein